MSKTLAYLLIGSLTNNLAVSISPSGCNSPMEEQKQLTPLAKALLVSLPNQLPLVPQNMTFSISKRYTISTHENENKTSENS